MKISIVTISFNQAKFLPQCMDSVLGQDYPNLEYIVVDPGSTDGSRDIIDAYDCGGRIKKIYDPDRGPANGLNKGFSAATGQIFGFLNSDDMLLPGALRKVARHFEDTNADVIAGGGFVTDRDGRVLRKVAASHLTPWLYIHGGVTIFQQGTFFRSACYRSVCGFNEENTTCWDGELFLDMAMAGARFKAIGDRLAAFRLHEDSISGSGRLEERYAVDCNRMFAKVKGRYRTPRDKVFDRIAQIGKFIRDPRYVTRRWFAA